MYNTCFYIQRIKNCLIPLIIDIIIKEENINILL